MEAVLYSTVLNSSVPSQPVQMQLSEILGEGRSVPEALVLRVITDRLESPDAQHYGYVLSCLPSMSEECLKMCDQMELIRNLKLPPDIVINIKVSYTLVLVMMYMYHHKDGINE
ncbi:hypothetical protein NHX12_026631 [Muraenolepis orangiensis]|uniref:Uncharacterized protein n=1 Tax=Muraenolepis orangiensis TaxID=630683 RepID=A0A9Q0EFG9_9TELE|nr:hypothetical protein NHX12_026631 [Muraenolepis orangiensis]